MDALDHALVLAAALAAGAINAVAGGGSLLTFPTLLAVGINPVPASITNTLGLMPGYLGGTHAYRAEVADQRHRVRVLVVPAGCSCAAEAELPRELELAEAVEHRHVVRVAERVARLVE